MVDARLADEMLEVVERGKADRKTSSFAVVTSTAKEGLGSNSDEGLTQVTSFWTLRFSTSAITSSSVG